MTKLSPRAVAAPVLGLLIAAVAIVLLASGGGGARTLDARAIEHSIQSSVLAEHGVQTNVSCPSGLPREAGLRFTCFARLGVGSYQVGVVVADGSGRVRYGNEQPLVILDTARVQRAIDAAVMQQRGLRASTRCPSEVLQQAGVEFHCTVAVGGGSRSYRFLVRELDNAGHVRYQGV